MIQHLDQVTDEHSATWYLIYRNTGEQRLHHEVFDNYEDAREEMLERINTERSNANEIIIRPYRISQNAQALLRLATYHR